VREAWCILALLVLTRLGLIVLD